MFQYWMVLKYLREGRRYLSLNFVLSVIGMALGVAALVISMAIVSGYETTLKRTLIDSFGHLVLVRRGEPFTIEKDFEQKLRAQAPSIQAMTPFLLVEAIAAKKGHIAGVFLEGMDAETHRSVLSLEKHVTAGNAEVSGATVLMGKELRKNLGLEVGDTFKVVIPVSANASGDRFRPRAMTFTLGGVLDLGRHDFDERYIVVDMGSLQKLIQIENKVTGLRIRLKGDPDQADAVGTALMEKLGYPYWIRSWRDSNRNLFEAIQYEKPVIFVIVSLIVLAAAFNIASSLYVSVLRRYRDISVLKTLGADPKFIRRLFTRQGLIVGAAGAALGVGFGLLFCQVLTFIQSYVNIFPGEVYRIDHVRLEVRWLDLLIIFLVSLVICYISTLSPARKGSKLTTVEGLRYE